MLFWIFVIALVVGIMGIITGWLMYEHTKYDTDWLKHTGQVITTLASVCIIVSIVFLCCSYMNSDAKIAANYEKYESLTYQLENNLYDNDNDLGKKELYSQIETWNTDLAYYQSIQDSFWLGIFYPNVFDQFDYIEYPEVLS